MTDAEHQETVAPLIEQLSDANKTELVRRLRNVAGTWSDETNREWLQTVLGQTNNAPDTWDKLTALAETDTELSTAISGFATATLERQTHKEAAPAEGIAGRLRGIMTGMREIAKAMSGSGPVSGEHASHILLKMTEHKTHFVT